MKKRVDYTTIAESKLGILLPEVEKKIQTLQESLANCSKENQTMESEFTAKQLAALMRVFKLLQSVLPSFDKGNKPNKVLFLARFSIPAALDLKSARADLASTRRAVYEIIKTELANLIRLSLEECKTKLTSTQFSNDFKDQFKKALRKQFINFSQRMPAKNLNKHLDELDKIITNFNLSPFITKEFRMSECEMELKKAIHTQFMKFHLPIDLMVVHPVSYQLICDLFLLLDEVTDTLDKFVSFLNPEAIAMGMTHITENAPSNWSYQIEKDIIDIANIFTLRKQEAPRFLSNKIRDYFNEYHDTVHVRSELAKMKLIHRFIQDEQQNIQNEVTSLFNTASKSSKEVTSGDTLQQVIFSLEGEEKAAREILQKLKIRSTAYQSRSLFNLLQNHTHLASQLSQDAETLDVNYANFILPEKLVILKEGAASSFEVCHVQKSLLENVALQQNSILVYLKELHREKVKFLQEYHAGEAIKISSRLDHLNESCTQLSKDDTPMPCSNLETLEQQLRDLHEKQRALVKAQDEFTHLEKLLEGPPYCPESLKDSLIPSIKQIYTPIKESSEKTKTLILQTHKNLREKEIKLNAQIEKERSAHAFSELMKGLNPEAIAKLKKEKEDLLNELSAEAKKISFEIDSKLSELVNLDDNFGKRNPLTWDDPLVKEKQRRNNLVSKILRNFAKIEDYLLKLTKEEKRSALVKNLFNFSQLETHSGSQKAFDWIESFLVHNETSLKHKGQTEAARDKNLKIHSALKAALMLCKSSSKNIASKMNGLKELNEIKGFYELKNRNAGLAVLGKILGQSEEVLLSYCENSSRFESLATEIQQSLNLKDQQLTSLDELLDMDEHYLSIKKDLHGIKEDLENLVSNNLNIEKKQEELDKKYLEIKQDIEGQSQRLKNTQAQLEKNIDNLNTEIQILEQIKSILEANEVLNDLLNASEEISEEGFAEAEVELEKLNHKYSVLKSIILQEAAFQDYRLSLEKIGELQEASAQRIFELRLSNFNNKFKAIQDALIGLPQDSTELLLQLRKQLEQLNLNRTHFISSFEKIDLLRRELDQLREKNSFKEEEAKRDLVILSNEIQENLLAKLRPLLDNYDRDINLNLRKLNISFNETQENYLAHSTIINQVSTYFSQLPKADLITLHKEFEKLNLSNSQIFNCITRIKTNIETLEQQLPLSKTICEGQQERLQKRVNLCEKYSNILSEYLNHRKTKYAVKDFFSRQDAYEREQFISHLKHLLEQYSHSGNSQDIVCYLLEKRPKFSGLRLQPLLSRLSIEIEELEKFVPSEQPNYVSRPLPLIPEHSYALGILERFASTHPEFYAAMLGLSSKIDCLEQYAKNIPGEDGRIAENLAIILRTKLDAYVVSQSEKKTIEADNFQAFRSDFQNHLHSQDDVMSNHREFWKPFLAGVIALLSLGLALGVKKIVTGRAAFFADTKRLQHIHEVEGALSVAVQAASAA